jgi:hypothetical protein
VSLPVRPRDLTTTLDQQYPLTTGRAFDSLRAWVAGTGPLPFTGAAPDWARAFEQVNMALLDASEDLEDHYQRALAEVHKPRDLTPMERQCKDWLAAEQAARDGDPWTAIAARAGVKVPAEISAVGTAAGSAPVPTTGPGEAL